MTDEKKLKNITSEKLMEIFGKVFKRLNHLVKLDK